MVMCIGGKRICLGIVFAKMHRDKMIHLDGVDKLLCAAHIIFTQAGIDGEHSGIKMWISSGRESSCKKAFSYPTASSHDTSSFQCQLLRSPA